MPARQHQYTTVAKGHTSWIRYFYGAACRLFFPRALRFFYQLDCRLCPPYQAAFARRTQKTSGWQNIICVMAMVDGFFQSTFVEVGCFCVFFCRCLSAWLGPHSVGEWPMAAIVIVRPWSRVAGLPSPAVW